MAQKKYFYQELYENGCLAFYFNTSFLKRQELQVEYVIPVSRIKTIEESATLNCKKSKQMQKELYSI